MVSPTTDVSTATCPHDIANLRTVAGQDQTVVRILCLELGKLLPVAFEGQVDVRNRPQLHRGDMLRPCIQMDKLTWKKLSR